VKLSTKFKMGYTRVQGGRVLRVANDHAVPTKGYDGSSNHTPDLANDNKPLPPRFTDGEKWVYAQAGDLALEILHASTKKLLGYTYLSGPAIQLNRYLAFPSTGSLDTGTPGNTDWHPANIARLTCIQREADLADLVTELQAFKQSQMDLGYFELRVRNLDEGRHAAETLAGIWQSIPTHDNGPDVLGIVEAGKADLALHFQNERHKNTYPATPFQMSLLLTCDDQSSETAS